MRIPWALRRFVLLFRGARTDRDRPDLDRLASIDDPMDFVWTILPHAARTFAPSILLLPKAPARAAAVAYLYCRMLDTYEDLSHPADCETALNAFGTRMTTLDPPPPVPGVPPRDDRDRVHLLLVERCELVDRAFATLPVADRRAVADLVAAMAEGMIWSTQRFSEQGGVLVDAEQVSRYCHHVIGEPILFTLPLVTGTVLTDHQRRDALASSELIQLANITRDVERDLERGIGYHPALLPHLGKRDVPEPVAAARRTLMSQALPHVPAYNRLATQLATGWFSPARASAVLMLLHTDRHYRWCADRIGHPGWRGPTRSWTILLASLPAVMSRRWADRMMRRVEHDFATAMETLSLGISTLGE
jgi:phytoene/squalene synthetase